LTYFMYVYLEDKINLNLNLLSLSPFLSLSLPLCMYVYTYIKLVCRRTIRRSMRSCNRAKKGHNSCNWLQCQPYHSSNIWVIFTSLSNILVSCRDSLKHLSVLNEHPSCLLEDVFVEDMIICIWLHFMQ
jgi:hypothetical protein